MTEQMVALERGKKKWIRDCKGNELPEPKPIEKMLYTVAFNDGWNACLANINEQYKKSTFFTKKHKM